MLYRGFGLLVVAVLQCSLPGCAALPAVRPGFTPLRVGQETLWVETAATEAARARGLMFRTCLPEDEGMLFVYPSMRPLSFWMRNTLIDLAIAFVDSGGIIVDIQEMKRLDETVVYSKHPAKYAIEAGKGWFGRHNVWVGDRVRFPEGVLRVVAEEQ